MDMCNHLKNQPSYKIEGGLCMDCEKYNCYDCMDFSYNLHIFSKYGKTHLSKIKYKTNYKFTSLDELNKLKDDDMLAVCYNCVEKINHPNIINKISYWCCGKYALFLVNSLIYCTKIITLYLTIIK